MKQLVGMPKTKKFKNQNKNHPTVRSSHNTGHPLGKQSCFYPFSHATQHSNHELVFEAPVSARRLNVVQFPPYLVLCTLPDGTGEQEPDICIFFFQCSRVTLLSQNSKNHLCVRNIHLTSINIQEHFQSVSSQSGWINKLLGLWVNFGHRTAPNFLHEIF